MKPYNPDWSDEQERVIRDGLRKMRNWRFYEAHERFEEAFREALGPQRIVLHGLAQIAAAHHQLALGRGRAAVRTWHKALEKLRRAGLEVDVLCAQMDEMHRALGLSEREPRFFDAQALTRFQSLPMLDEAMLHMPSA